MADWNNLTKEDAAALAVAQSCSMGPVYVGPIDEHTFDIKNTGVAPNTPGASAIVIDEDTGYAYEVTLVAQRAPQHDD